MFSLMCFFSYKGHSCIFYIYILSLFLYTQLAQQERHTDSRVASFMGQTWPWHSQMFHWQRLGHEAKANKGCWCPGGKGNKLVKNFLISQTYP